MADIQEVITEQTVATPAIETKPTYFENKTLRSEEIQAKNDRAERRINNSGIISAAMFLLISIIGVFILMKKGASIWFYLLLFVVIAPFVSSASGFLFYSIKSNLDKRNMDNIPLKPIVTT